MARLKVYFGANPEEENPVSAAPAHRPVGKKATLLASHSDWSKADYFSKYVDE